MSASNVSNLNLSSGDAVPLSRLTHVEFRKMGDTRAALWLLLVTAMMLAGIMLIVVVVSVAKDLSISYTEMLGVMNVPMALFLPLIGIMLITQEWGQRTAMTTFSLEPRRGRIIVAKLLAGVGVSLAAALLAMVLSALTVLMVSVLGGQAEWDPQLRTLLGFGAVQLIGIGTGYFFGMLLLNTAAAIVLYFVFEFFLPMVFTVLVLVFPGFAKVQPWIDLGSATNTLLSGDMTGREVAQLSTSVIVWLVIPLVLGVWRMLRAELK